MKQIKTIRKRLDSPDDFDREVNKALEEGWTLTKRRTLIPKAQGGTYTYIMLYAELEKGDEKAKPTLRQRRKKQ